MSPLAVQWQALEPSEFAVDLADYRNDLRFVKYETEVLFWVNNAWVLAPE